MRQDGSVVAYTFHLFIIAVDKGPLKQSVNNVCINGCASGSLCWCLPNQTCTEPLLINCSVPEQMQNTTFVMPHVPNPRLFQWLLLPGILTTSSNLLTHYNE